MMRLFIALLFCAATATATQRHATPTGAGAHTGMDESNAWSFAEAMYAETGDTVNLHAGTYPYIFAPENSGTGSQPIVFRAFESDVVTITGASDGNPDMVYFPGSYVELWNVYLITAENVAWNGNYAVSLGGDHNALHGVRLIKGGDIQTEYLSNNYRTRGVNIYGSYNTIDSCWIRGMVESVVLSGGSARYHKIRWNRIHNSALNGIICGGSNDGTTNWMGVLIEGNNIDSCGEDNMQWQQGTDPYSYEKNKGYIVRGNYLARAYENAIDRKGAAFVVCENNIMHTANSDDDGWTNGAEDWGTGPLIERGNPEVLNEYYCLDRGNVMLDGPGGTTMSHGGQFINNLMANNRRKLTVSNTSDSTEDALKDINLEGSSTTRSVLNNILIGQPNHSYVWLWNMETSPLDIDNQLYYDTTGALRFYYRLSGGTSAKVYGLSAWQSRLNTTYTSFTGRDAHAISSDPLFVNFPFRPYSYNASWDWSLDAGSPAIGVARCWTFANGSGSSSTALVVDNPYVFTDGFGIVHGDSVYLHGAARRITSINYSTSTITLSASHTWSDNDSVWFYTAGAKVTNLGPYANVTTVVDTGGDPGGAPATPTALTPANGSTKTSPVTFSWNRVSGAVDYWLCVSPDSWGTLIVDQAAITDTFYTVSLPGSGSYVWNVSAANSYGRSGWTADRTFSTASTSAFRDTLTLSWNIVKHAVTMDSNTVIKFSSLQRTQVYVVVKNPNGKELSWVGVTWQTGAPPTIPGDLTMYDLFWVGGDTVIGRYINNTALASVTWNSITGSISGNAALVTALAAKPDTNTVPHALNVKAYDASGDGATDDITPIRRAFAAADSGDVVHFPKGVYIISDTVLIARSGVTVEGDGATIRQTTAGSKIFRVTGDRVHFRNLTLIGDTNGSYTNNPDHNVGIDFAKDTYGHVVEHCEFSTLDIAIYCHRVDMMTVRGNYIHDVYQGVVGGYTSMADRLNGPSSYMIDGNRIHCAFGPLNYSRPIWLPYSDNFIVSGNELRGGGMAFEALTTSTAETTLFVKIFSGNSCDAAASGPSLVEGNVFDTHYAPTGRGPQNDYFQAIEVGFRGTISNNVVRNFNVAVGNTARLGRIIGNIFEACGDSMAPGADGVVAVNPYAEKDTSGAIISGNTFIGSNMADIAANWAAGSDTVYDVIVTNNYSLNGRNEFFKAARTQGVMITGNVIRDANSGDSTDQAYAVRLAGGVTGYVDALSVTNSVALPYGTVNAVAANAGVVIGYGSVKGLRGSGAYDVSGGAEVIGRTEVDGAVSAVTYDNMAIHGTNPVLSIEQSNGGGTPNMIIYDSTLTKYAQYKLDVANSRAYYSVASGMSHYWNVGSTNVAYWTATRLRSNVEHLFVGPILALDNYKILNKAGSDYNTVMTRNTSGPEAVYDLNYIGKLQLGALHTAPANAGATGTLGEIRIVDGYIYVCTATNTWKRAAISTWP